MDKTNCATSFFTYMVDVKRPEEAARDQNPKKFRRGHPLHNFVVKVKLHVRLGVLHGGNNHGLSLGSIGREMVVYEPAVDGVYISLEVRQVRRK